MTLSQRLLHRIRRLFGWGGYDRSRWDVLERVDYLENVVEYLEWQVSQQASLVRHLSAPIMKDLPLVKETKASFDFQWNRLPAGRFMLSNPEFRKEAPDNIAMFTGLKKEWFKGKTVIDVGCGQGRYSWAFCTLGAQVLSLDQSEHGLARTVEACREFSGHRAMKIDLLQPLPITEQADMVWSFGVLHHTGDTYSAFKHVVPLVKPGGYLSLMIYGEPRRLFAGDYMAVTEYDYWRQRTRNLSSEEKVTAIERGMAKKEFHVNGTEHVHGYFDAISPPINDLYTFEELEQWLLMAGFDDIRRTMETRNHHILARRVR